MIITVSISTFDIIQSIMGKLIISESISPDRNYAIVEDGEVKVVLNESTKKKGYMPITEASDFARSLLEAKIERDKQPPCKG